MMLLFELKTWWRKKRLQMQFKEADVRNGVKIYYKMGGGNFVPRCLHHELYSHLCGHS